MLPDIFYSNWICRPITEIVLFTNPKVKKSLSFLQNQDTKKAFIRMKAFPVIQYMSSYFLK